MTGHSLGGALANILGNYLEQRGYWTYHYTFAGPPIGDYCVSKNINRRIGTRYVKRVIDK